MTDAGQAVREAAATIPAEVCARFEAAAKLSDEDKKTIVEIARKALAPFQPKVVEPKPEHKAGSKPKAADKAKPEVKADPKPKIESPLPAEVKPSAKVESKGKP